MPARAVGCSFSPSIAARRSDRDVGACSQWGVVTIMIHDRMHLLRERITGGNGGRLERLGELSFVSLMAVAIASAIYFFPIARLVDSLGD